VNGQKMSKSRGNIHYTDTLLNQGYDPDQIRFFLIYGHYRKKLNYSEEAIRLAADRLKAFKERVRALKNRADQNTGATIDENGAGKVRSLFREKMDDDLDVKGAFDSLHDFLVATGTGDLAPAVASGYIKALKEIDQVLQVLS
jgi:cysteinyl-tRNA synthetase